jgi:hypothetical protein
MDTTTLIPTTIETLVPEPQIIRSGNLAPTRTHKAICPLPDCRGGRRWATHPTTEQIARSRYLDHYLSTHPVVRTVRDLDTPWTMYAPWAEVVDLVRPAEGEPGFDNPDRVDVVFADGTRMAYTYSSRVYLRRNGAWDMVCDWLPDWRFRP